MKKEPQSENTVETQKARFLKIINMLRLHLAMWIWPKTVRAGDCFTLTAILQLGQPTNDGSWVGHTLRADKVEGDRIFFSEWARYTKRFHPVGHVLIPRVNCLVKLIANPVPDASESANASSKQKQA